MSIKDPTQRSGVAVITGASRGIGAAIAERLASEGMAVACAATSAKNAEAVVARVSELYGVPAMALEMRVQDMESVEAGLQAVEAALGPVSVMVNNAGISQVKNFLDLPAAEFSHILDINLRGVFHGSQAAARCMTASGTKGNIVQIGSVTGVTAFPERVGYCSTKAAVHHMTKVMSLDLAAHGIRVNCVAPGYIRTDLVQDLINVGTLDEVKLQKRVPMGELGSVDDVANAVAWISSDEAKYVTGETLVIDGGWLAYGSV